MSRAPSPSGCPHAPPPSPYSPRGPRPERLEIPLDLRLAIGRETAASPMVGQDKVWSRFSDDKVNIGVRLMQTLRQLHRSAPPDLRLRGLSLGSSSEPQFRILQAACEGGLYLMDIENAALDALRERIARQHTQNARAIAGDFVRELADPASARRFRAQMLHDRRVHLVTLHHSLYYSSRARWNDLINSIGRELLDPHLAALHAVLMVSRSTDPSTTTWLYNHFAGRFFGARNDQDLRGFGESLLAEAHPDSRVRLHTDRVRFLAEDFESLMAVVWMILLHPHVHRFSLTQQDEVTQHIYHEFWLPRRPLFQDQDHLILLRARAPHHG